MLHHFEDTPARVVGTYVRAGAWHVGRAVPSHA